MSKRNGRLTQKDLERLDREEREVTRHGFDGGKWGAWLDDAAEQHGVDPDLLASQLAARAVRAALASHETHNERVKQLEDRTPAEQRPALRAKLKHIDRERGYRTQLVTVRDLHADPTGTKVRYFLGAVPSVIRSHRPVAAARARRPRRSSSSSRTSGVDPGGGDSDDGPPPRRPARYSYAALTAAERAEVRSPAFYDQPDWSAIAEESDRRNDEEYERLLARTLEEGRS